MNIGRDKSTFPMPMWMPMNTHGRDLGYTVKLDLPLSTRHTLQVGNELHRLVLDDTWPAVPGKGPMMGPNTFVNINDGRRIRLGTSPRYRASGVPNGPPSSACATIRSGRTSAPCRGIRACMRLMPTIQRIASCPR